MNSNHTSSKLSFQPDNLGATFSIQGSGLYKFSQRLLIMIFMPIRCIAKIFKYYLFILSFIHFPPMRVKLFDPLFASLLQPLWVKLCLVHQSINQSISRSISQSEQIRLPLVKTLTNLSQLPLQPHFCAV